MKGALLAGTAAVAAGAWMVGASSALLMTTGLWDHPYFVGRPEWAWAWASYALNPQMRAALGGTLWWTGAIPAALTAGLGWRIWTLTGGRRKPLYGESDFASRREAERRGLVYTRRPLGDGILLGRTKGWLGLGRRYISLAKPEHVALYAMTGAGKGVSFVIPNSLAWEGSMVFLDVKGELWTKTAGHRAAMGQTCFRFSPTAPDGLTHRFNPLSHLPQNTADRIDAIHRRMALLVPPPPGRTENPFWTNAARALAAAGAIMLAETPGEDLNPAAILRMFTRPDHRAYLAGLASAARAVGQPLPEAAVNVVLSWANSEDAKTRDGILEELKSQFGIYASPRIAAATEVSDFDLAEIRKRPISIYLGMTPDELRRLRPLTTVLFQQLVTTNSQVEFDRDPDHRFRAIAMLDEFWAVGEMKVLADAAAFLRSYGIYLAYVVQTKAQTQAQYGREGSNNLFGNAGVEIMFGSKDPDLLREVSERAGTNTVVETTTNRPRFLGWLWPNRQSATDSARKQALMLPQEIARMKPSEQLIFRAGMQPLKTQRVVYYRDRYFRRLQRDPPLVPSLVVRVPYDAGPPPPPPPPEPPRNEQLPSAHKMRMMPAGTKRGAARRGKR